MEFLDTTEGLVLFALVGLIISCIILYHIIKAAIKDAFREMEAKRKHTETSPIKPVASPAWNEAQLALKNRYEKGEITLDEYTAEWNKLS